MNSDLFKLNFLDLLKAALLFFLSMVVSFFYERFSTGTFPDSAAIVAELKVAGIAAGAYLLKQLISGNNGVPLARGNIEEN